MTTLETGPDTNARTAASSELEATLLARVADIAEVIAGGTEYANRERHLSPEVVDALSDAELFSMFTSARFGGLGADARTISSVLQAIARSCGSAAWVTMITNGGNFYATRFPDEALHEVYDGNPGARLAAVTSMNCTFEPTAGGYIVSGRWPYSSGITHDHWAVLGNATLQAIIPRSDFTIEETWDTVGMRGTGSHTAVVDGAFVPDHRVLPMPQIMGYAMCTDPDAPAELRLAPMETSLLILASVVVGLGQRACDLIADGAAKRFVIMSPYANAAESPVYRAVLGECIMRIETARLHLAESARVLDVAAVRGEMLSDLALTRVRANICHAVRSVTTSLDDIMYLGGAGAFATSSPLQQVWRDANTGARHGVLNAFVNYEWLGAVAVNPEMPIFKP